MKNINLNTNTNKYTLILSMVAVLALGACGTAPQKPVVVPQPAVQADKKVDIDPQLITDCPTTTLLPEQSMTKVQALKEISNLIGLLSTCWHRHHDLSTLAASAFNINVPPQTPTPAAPVGASGVSVPVSK